MGGAPRREPDDTSRVRQRTTPCVTLCRRGSWVERQLEAPAGHHAACPPHPCSSVLMPKPWLLTLKQWPPLLAVLLADLLRRSR